MEEERKTPEEVRWFLSKLLDGVTLEMNKGVFRVVYSYSNKKRRYELRIWKENNILFYAEGSFWETPIRMLENHAMFLKLVAKALREMADPLEKLLARSEEVGEQKEEGEQEEEREE